MTVIPCDFGLYSINFLPANFFFLCAPSSCFTFYFTYEVKMSLQHSPPAKNSETSDLRVGNVTSRKKKTSENDVTVLIAEFRREIKETLTDYKEEIRQDLLSTFKTHLDNQNDILYKLREDFCDVKNEISAIKQTNNKLRQEQTQLKSALAAQKRDHDAINSKVTWSGILPTPSAVYLPSLNNCHLRTNREGLTIWKSWEYLCRGEKT